MARSSNPPKKDAAKDDPPLPKLANKSATELKQPPKDSGYICRERRGILCFEPTEVAGADKKEKLDLRAIMKEGLTLSDSLSKKSKEERSQISDKKHTSPSSTSAIMESSIRPVTVSEASTRQTDGTPISQGEDESTFSNKKRAARERPIPNLSTVYYASPFPRPPVLPTAEPTALFRILSSNSRSQPRSNSTPSTIFSPRREILTFRLHTEHANSNKNWLDPDRVVITCISFLPEPHAPNPPSTYTPLVTWEDTIAALESLCAEATKF